MTERESAATSGHRKVDTVPTLVSEEGGEAAMIAEQLTHQTTPGEDRPRVSAVYVWLVVLATFGSIVALVGPIGYSLSVLLERIAPENKEFLGYVTGVGALVVVLAGPLVGILSDRTRSRLGRQRPWLIGLTMVGLAGLLIVSVSPNVWIALLGWGVTQLGFGIAGLQVTSSMGDRLPESQRGKVAGLTGVATMVASIAGVGLASAFATSNLLIFLFPGLVGATFILLFAVFVKEPDLRNAAAPEKVTMGSLLSGYGYNVKKYKDFPGTGSDGSCSISASHSPAPSRRSSSPPSSAVPSVRSEELSRLPACSASCSPWEARRSADSSPTGSSGASPSSFSLESSSRWARSSLGSLRICRCC